MTRAERDAEILARAAAGESERAIAKALGISRSSIWDVKQRAKKPADRAGEEA